MLNHIFYIYNYHVIICFKIEFSKYFCYGHVRYNSGQILAPSNYQFKQIHTYEYMSNTHQIYISRYLSNIIFNIELWF